jgi:hypothetical protein
VECGIGKNRIEMKIKKILLREIYGGKKTFQEGSRSKTFGVTRCINV